MIFAGVFGLADEAASYAFVASGSAITSSGVATIASLSFGADAGNRRVFVTIQWSCGTEVTTRLITSATIGGAAATVHVQTNANTGATSTNYGCAIISAVTAGTSGDIVVGLTDATDTTVYAQTHRVTGLVSATAHDIAAAFDEAVPAPTIATATASTTISVQSSGLLILSAALSSFGSGSNMTFVGATERYDANGLVDDRLGCAGSSGLSVEAARVISVSDTSDATIRARLCGASFQLA